MEYLVSFRYTPRPEWGQQAQPIARFAVNASSPLGAIRKGGGMLRYGYTRYVAEHVTQVSVQPNA